MGIFALTEVSSLPIICRARAGATLQGAHSATHADEEEAEEGVTGENAGSTSGPAAVEHVSSSAVRQSVTFRKGGPKGANSYVRALSTLPPFVSRMLKEDVALNDAKYRLFDQTAARELTAASKTLEASMTEFQGAVMIADVKGFTQLTEILSKKGAHEVRPRG